jgi:hypothetical protein
MGLIYNYPYDNDVQDSDAWIGTNQPNRKTKQYTALAVANYLNTQGKISIAGQMTYKFVTSPYVDPGTIAFPAGGGSGTNFSAITTLVIADTDLGSQNVVNFLTYLVGGTILIVHQQDISVFGHYTVDSYSTTATPGFHVFTLTQLGSAGAIEANEVYDIASFFTAETGDKNYIFTQIAAAATWNVTHNLNKYPSVSVVDSGNNWVVGDVEYINENQLTITFNAAFSGKAYLN